MKTLIKKLEKTMAAVAFAEAGEHETARQIMSEDRVRKSDRPSKRQRSTARKEMRAD